MENSKNKSYCDSFDDGVFNATVRGGLLSRPSRWPISVSGMQRNTHYSGNGMDISNGDVVPYAYGVGTIRGNPYTYYNSGIYDNYAPRSGEWSWMDSN